MVKFSKILALYPDDEYSTDTLCYKASVGDGAGIQKKLDAVPYEERMRLLHELDRRSRSSAIHHAARNGQNGCLQLLLRYGANVNQQNLQGETALHHAIWLNDPLSRPFNPDMIQLLLNAGAEIDLADRDGDPPLFFAMSYEAVDYLLHRGANIRAINNKKQTVLLHWLERDEICDEQVLRLLLDCGCPVDARGFVKRQGISSTQAISPIEFCRRAGNAEYVEYMLPYSNEHQPELSSSIMRSSKSDELSNVT